MMPALDMLADRPRIDRRPLDISARALTSRRSRGIGRIESMVAYADMIAIHTFANNIYTIDWRRHDQKFPFKIIVRGAPSLPSLKLPVCVTALDTKLLPIVVNKTAQGRIKLVRERAPYFAERTSALHRFQYIESTYSRQSPHTAYYSYWAYTSFMHINERLYIHEPRGATSVYGLRDGQMIGQLKFDHEISNILNTVPWNDTLICSDGNFISYYRMYPAEGRIDAKRIHSYLYEHEGMSLSIQNMIYNSDQQYSLITSVAECYDECDVIVRLHQSRTSGEMYGRDIHSMSTRGAPRVHTAWYDCNTCVITSPELSIYDIRAPQIISRDMGCELSNVTCVGDAIICIKDRREIGIFI